MLFLSNPSRYFFITAFVVITVNMGIARAAVSASLMDNKEDITLDSLKMILNNTDAVQEKETREKLSLYFEQNKKDEEGIFELIRFLFKKYMKISSIQISIDPINLNDFKIEMDSYGWFYIHIISMLSLYLKQFQDNDNSLNELIGQLKRDYGYDNLFKFAVMNLRIGVIESKKSKKESISLDDFKKDNFNDRDKDIFYIRIVPMFSQYLKQYTQDTTIMEQQFLALTRQLEKDYGVTIGFVIIVANLSFNGMTEQEILEWSNQMSQTDSFWQQFKNLMVFLSERYMPSYFRKYFFSESQ